jgi:hypothetical protein
MSKTRVTSVKISQDTKLFKKPNRSKGEINVASKKDSLAHGLQRSLLGSP